MSEPCEIVVCHDILQVPYEASYLLVWAATQTFTIQHLSDENEGADTNCNSVPADLGNLETDRETCFSSSYPNENFETQESMLNHSDSYLRTLTTNKSDAECISYEINILSDESSNSQDADESNAMLGDPLSADSVEEDERPRDPLEKPVTTVSNFLPRYTGPRKSYAHVDGEIVCGVCEMKFKTDSAMHHHRVEHFGYYCGSDRPKKCVFCGDKFQSIVSLSKHLFEHYPKMIMMRKIKALNSERRNLRAESSIKSISRKPARTKTNACSSIALVSDSAIMNGSPKIVQQNYPLTNNDRQRMINEQHALLTDELETNTIRNEFAEFTCGVCEMKFRNPIIMHNHRIGHFGYYRSLGLGRKCVFCSERLTSVPELSEHLFLHYPNLKCPRSEDFSET